MEFIKNYRNALAEEIKKQFNKMEEKGLIRIIEQEGIGKYLDRHDNKNEKDRYKSYVKLCLTNNNKYFVGISKNPLYSKNRYNLEKCLYDGINFSKAKEIFNEVVQKDLNKKANKVHKIFGRN